MSMRCIEVCFDMFEIMDVDQKCFEMFLKSFAKEFQVENQKNGLWKLVSLTMRLRSQTHARRMALQGCFSSYWKSMRLSFLDATLDAWWFPARFSRNATFFQSQSSMRLTMRLTYQTHRRRMKLQNRFSSYWNFMRLTMRLSLRCKPQTHENPEMFFQGSESSNLCSFVRYRLSLIPIPWV